MFFKYFFAMLIALNLSHAYAEDKERLSKKSDNHKYLRKRTSQLIN